MAVSLTTISSQVIAQMNLNTSYSSSSTDPRAYTQQVTDAVLSADGMVVEALLQNPANGRRVGFLASTTVAHGSQLPSHVGPITVIINSKAAVEWDRSEIENERLNRLALTTINAHYDVDDGNVLYHNGATAATVQYASYTRTTACQAPDEYGFVVAAGAMALMFSIEGENDGTAAMYGQQFASMLGAIRAGSMPQQIQS